MSTDPIVPTPQPRRNEKLTRVFLGAQGLRAGWGIFVFIFFVALVGPALTWAMRPLVSNSQQARPSGMIPVEIMLFAAIAIPTFLMSRIEGRPFGAYGLGARGAFGKYFWQGALAGLVMLTAVMLCMMAVHTYNFGHVVLRSTDIVKYGVLWAIGFLCVGFFEEFCFRGYFLYSLTRGLGFWPAAIISSLLFALAHRGNDGETWMGLAEIVLIALVFCVSVQRTGSLWWAVGIHMSYDWGESFLFSVPNSGTHVVGHLSNATLLGNSWLSGGTVGPEASVFNFVAEAGLLIFVMWFYPERKYPEYVEVPAQIAESQTGLNLNT